ncbi:MAG: Sec-independent protein translocase TatA [Planctomycetaceae bacterium]|nr:Sec-independent protein translocase TatA [Planctomycetaceae bacterium]
MLNSLLAIGMPGPFEMMIIGVIMLLLFGNRLPSLMRSLGRGVIEFKKGVHGIEDELESSIENDPSEDKDDKDD